LRRWWAGPDLNRRPSPRQGMKPAPFSEKTINWDVFKIWLEKQLRPRTVKDRLKYARKYAHCLFQRDFSQLNLVSESERQHALKGLSALSKFLGVYEEFRTLVKNYGVKWAGKRSEELIIERLTKTVNGNELAEWVKSVKQALPELSIFLDFIASTGLRFEESINAYNLIIDLASHGKLNEYYNAENRALEHFRFKELFIRNSKKAFISFVSQEMVNKIAKSEKLTYNSIHCKLKRRKMRLKFADLREYYASVMTKYLSQPEIDFVQGRISTSIFMRNYFNPAWIQDLKTRALKGAKELLAKINGKA